MKIVLHAITIMLAQMGVFVWSRVTWTEEWINAYYIWDKGILVLLVLCCISPVRIMRPYWIVTGVFFAVRLLAEFIAAFYDVQRVLFDYRVIFLTNLLCTAWIILYRTKGCKRAN